MAVISAKPEAAKKVSLAAVGRFGGHTFDSKASDRGDGD
jgi:hypothetical protein